VKKTKIEYFLRSNGINEMITNTEESSFSEVMFKLRRLVCVEKIVRRRVFSKSRLFVAVSLDIER